MLGEQHRATLVDPGGWILVPKLSILDPSHLSSPRVASPNSPAAPRELRLSTPKASWIHGSAVWTEARALQRGSAQMQDAKRLLQCLNHPTWREEALSGDAEGEENKKHQEGKANT